MTASRPPSRSRDVPIYDDGYRNEDDDVDMRDAPPNASRGGGRVGGRGREAGNSRRDDSRRGPSSYDFTARCFVGSIGCECSICRRHRDHVVDEGLRNNPSVEKAKRELAEQMAARRDQQELDALRRQLDTANARASAREEEVRNLQRQLEDSRRNEERARRELDRVRTVPDQPPAPSFGYSRGARYRDEPYWDYRDRDRRDRSPPRRRSPPPRKRGLSDEWRAASAPYEPPRQLLRDDRYDGSRREPRDNHSRSERREPQRQGPERHPAPSTSASVQASTSAASSKGKQREVEPEPTPVASTSAVTLPPAPADFLGWGEYSATPGPTTQGVPDDQASDNGSDISNASDEPPMNAAALAAMHQARARRGVGEPQIRSPHAPVADDVASFLRDRIHLIERLLLRFQPHANGVNPVQWVFNDLTARGENANMIKKKNRTPYQRAIADFVVLPRAPGVRSKGHRRAPDDDDGLGLHLAYALQESMVQPRGILVFNVPDHNNRRGVAVSQVRTRITLRRMLPLHSDMYSNAAADDHFNFITEMAMAIARIVTESPTPGAGTPGYRSYQDHLGLSGQADRTPRILRRWERLEGADGPVSPERVVRFFTAVGISSAEFNDMLPFVVQLLWDNVVYGVDDTGDSMTLYQRLRDLIVAANGRWPIGLPGPTIFSQVPGDLSVSYAWPRLPGHGQPLLVHTGPSTGTGSFLADPNFYSSRQPTLDEYRQFGQPNGIPIAPWPRVGLAAEDEDAEMAEANDAPTEAVPGPSIETGAASIASAQVELSAPGPSQAPPTALEDVEMEDRKLDDVKTDQDSADKSDRAKGKQKDPNP
ncbi:uncharacterized protein SCHCODRAFT_02609388 [Schizophyllum commune H4-8]|uniref:Expressed protein n=1 Tax=Schizophyllum commune (strain H4-8 / FGSC 9210) TaxID=578458 RepID=D8PLC3_SCHCM|nr:uncharacterized protein SCHCODRAFT_02609388 [Schizophyllum commune H4-8]KAI5897448.1 hypothetical protein SCHCODRAFT_02609388 [Schizophyllum commune H4-8]